MSTKEIGQPPTVLSVLILLSYHLSLIAGLKDITTNAELREYLNTPGVAETFPTEHDGRHFVSRVYHKDPTLSKLNWCRTLDYLHSLRVVCRNHGNNETSKIAKAGTDDVPVVLLGLPSPEDLFKRLWDDLPDFIRAKIAQWAKSKMEGPIANQIRDAVKKVLLNLPLPIPHFFVNAVVNIVIPPLVKHILVFLGSPVGPVSLLSAKTMLINIIE